MPHAQRKRSETGFYHVVSKGDGGQLLFEDQGDRARYLDELESACGEWRVEVHAFCLMSNHVHLLVRDKEADLSDFMKQLNENFARWFTSKTKRVGHVFQGRFWSEPVDCDSYFLSAMRYIHANPEAANICKAKDYPWSSYGAYIGNKSFVTTSLGLSMLGGPDEFEKFHERASCYARPFSTSTLTGHLAQDELLNVAIAVVGRETINTIRTLLPKQRAAYLHMLHDAGLTQSEIARVTGLGKGTVRNAFR